MIESFSIKNAGPVTQFELKKAGAINLLVGPNSCGKTFVLKMLYTAMRAIEETKRGKEFRTTGEILANKLHWTFQADKIGDLVTKGSEEPLNFAMSFAGSDFKFSFGKDTNKQISNVLVKTEVRKSNSVFLPAKETLSIHSIILDTRLNAKSFGFDDTYLDLALALQSGIQGGSNDKFSDASTQLKKFLGGRIELDKNSKQWYYSKGNVKYTIGTTAEGIKKIAILDALLENQYLDAQSILFFDEPESALHPRAISQLLDILFLLSQAGIQVFMATHSYFVIKKLFLLAQEHKISIPVACKDNDNNWEYADLLNEMPENSIIAESVELYKQEVRLQL